MADTQAQIACGTTFAWATLAAPTVFQVVDEFVSIGDIGSVGEFVDVTRLDSADCRREFVGGLLEGADKELRFHKIPADVNQDLLIAAAEARDTVLVQVDIVSLDLRYEFKLALSGHRVPAIAPNEAVDFMIAGKETGPLTETTPIV